MKAEWDESVRELFVHHQEPQRTISYHSVQRRSSNIHFGRVWDTLGHFGTSQGSGNPFEGGMERERTRAVCAPSGTPAYNFVPFRSEAAFKYQFWSDLGHFGTTLGSGKPFEGGMERERTRAICAPSGTPAYDFVPFRLEAGFK